MKPIWDGDVLRYQVGFAAEAYWKLLNEERGTPTEDPPPFEIVQDMLEGRISNTHAIIETKESPIFYFTGQTNFRDEISTTGYKLKRGGKPFHYYNISAYLHGNFECITVEGLEADDLLAIEAMKDPDNTIIITIDKDLAQVPCWHYRYEYGKVPSFGPIKADVFGRIWVEGKKLLGYGEKFFYAQCLMGDPVDSIIGIPKMGPVGAFKTLNFTKTSWEAFQLVRGTYEAVYGKEGDKKLLENGRLLWMTRELKEGKPVLWEFPDGDNN